GWGRGKTWFFVRRDRRIWPARRRRPHARQRPARHAPGSDGPGTRVTYLPLRRPRLPPDRRRRQRRARNHDVSGRTGMRNDLSRFIQHARERGFDHAAIFELLRSAGWKDQEIGAAIAATELAMPIPERPGVGSARDAFYHLLAFTALYS